MVRARASRGAITAMGGARGDVEARAVAVAECRFASGLALAARAHEPGVAGMLALAAILRIAFEVHTAIAAALAPRFASDLTLAVDATRVPVHRIATGSTASAAIFRITLQVRANVAAGSPIGTGEIAGPVQANGYAVGRGRASGTAAATVFGIRVELHALVSARDAAFGATSCIDVGRSIDVGGSIVVDSDAQ